MRILLLMFTICSAIFSTYSHALEPKSSGEQLPLQPSFSFEWNVNKTFSKKRDEFTLTGVVEFPKVVSVSAAFLDNFLSEQAVTSVVHSVTGVKTLNQDFDGSKNPKVLPELGKVVSFRVTGQKCKFIFCRSGTMESNCKFTEIAQNRSVLECAGVPNDNMKSHSTKISCIGGANAYTQCSFELKGQPGSKRYALGGAAESLYSFYGLAFRSVSHKFSEEEFVKTGVPSTINKFYESLIGAADKNTYTHQFKAQ